MTTTVSFKETVCAALYSVPGCLFVNTESLGNHAIRESLFSQLVHFSHLAFGELCLRARRWTAQDMILVEHLLRHRKVFKVLRAVICACAVFVVHCQPFRARPNKGISYKGVYGDGFHCASSVKAYTDTRIPRARQIWFQDAARPCVVSYRRCGSADVSLATGFISTLQERDQFPGFVHGVGSFHTTIARVVELARASLA